VTDPGPDEADWLATVSNPARSRILRVLLEAGTAERETGRADATVRLDADALTELRALTASYLARLGELGLQTRERRGAEHADDESDLTAVAVLFATDDGGEHVTPAWR